MSNILLNVFFILVSAKLELFFIYARSLIKIADNVALYQIRM